MSPNCVSLAAVGGGVETGGWRAFDWWRGDMDWTGQERYPLRQQNVSADACGRGLI